MWYVPFLDDDLVRSESSLINKSCKEKTKSIYKSKCDSYMFALSKMSSVDKIPPKSERNIHYTEPSIKLSLETFRPPSKSYPIRSSILPAPPKSKPSNKSTYHHSANIMYSIEKKSKKDRPQINVSPKQTIQKEISSGISELSTFSLAPVSSPKNSNRASPNIVSIAGISPDEYYNNYNIYSKENMNDNDEEEIKEKSSEDERDNLNENQQPFDLSTIGPIDSEAKEMVSTVLDNNNNEILPNENEINTKNSCYDVNNILSSSSSSRFAPPYCSSPSISYSFKPSVLMHSHFNKDKNKYFNHNLDGLNSNNSPVSSPDLIRLDNESEIKSRTESCCSVVDSLSNETIENRLKEKLTLDNTNELLSLKGDEENMKRKIKLKKGNNKEIHSYVLHRSYRGNLNYMGRKGNKIQNLNINKFDGINEEVDGWCNNDNEENGENEDVSLRIENNNGNRDDSDDEFDLNDNKTNKENGMNSKNGSNGIATNIISEKYFNDKKYNVYDENGNVVEGIKRDSNGNIIDMYGNRITNLDGKILKNKDGNMIDVNNSIYNNKNYDGINQFQFGDIPNQRKKYQNKSKNKLPSINGEKILESDGKDDLKKKNQNGYDIDEDKINEELENEMNGKLNKEPHSPTSKHSSKDKSSNFKRRINKHVTINTNIEELNSENENEKTGMNVNGKNNENGENNNNENALESNENKNEEKVEGEGEDENGVLKINKINFVKPTYPDINLCDYVKKPHLITPRPTNIVEAFDNVDEIEELDENGNKKKKGIAYNDAVLLFKKYGHNTTEVILKSFQAALGEMDNVVFTRESVELFSDMVAYFTQKFGLSKLGPKEFEQLIEDIKYWSSLFNVYDMRKENLIYYDDLKTIYKIPESYLVVLFPDKKEVITKREYFEHIGFYLELHEDLLEQVFNDDLTLSQEGPPELVSLSPSPHESQANSPKLDIE